MQRQPRAPDEAIFSARFFRAIVWYGALITFVTMGAFWIGLQSDEEPASPRAVTMCFMTLALAQTFHLGNARSEEHVLTIRQAVSNPIALGAVALVVVLQVLAVHFQPLATVLRTGALGARDWVLCLSLAFIPAVAGQLARWIHQRQ
jgi:Ca2+-transporting ATPase